MAPILDLIHSHDAPEHTPLGEVLIARGIVDEASILRAVERQRREGGRLGELLVMAGALKWPDLAEALGAQLGIATIDLIQQPVDASLLNAQARESYRLHGWIPWRKEGDTLIVAAKDMTPALLQEVRHWVGLSVPLAFLLTSPRDIQHTLATHYASALDAHALHDLRQRYPLWSAQRQSGDGWAFASLYGLVAVVALSPFYAPLFLSVLVFCNVLFLGAVLFKWVLVHEGRHRVAPPPHHSLPDNGLPIYSVLVPLYAEAESVPGILAALAALDYPKHRLDVKLVIESDDAETLSAAYEAHPPAYVEILRVPVSQPRTKPKACNYALQFAHGEYVTIYDAEDRPDSDQLRKAVVMFLQSPPDVVCLQARLNYYNRHESWLTRFFALEYALLFDRMIPALSARGIPIPLGGTSNHIALGRLRALGAWDPYNVTEDADLGLRLAAAGLKTMPLDSLTWEEAPLTLRPWLKQRARWVKGYLTTWMVHTRAPAQLIHHCGVSGMLGLQFLIGGASLIYLLAPVLWSISALWLVMPHWLPALPSSIAYLNLLTLMLGFISQWHMAASIRLDLGWRGMKMAVFGFPFYWFLHSVASFRALWQLIFSPFHWDKTSHGLTTVKDRQIPPSVA
ncbi:MAG: glycosyltransferase [Rickettsiales bacterium]|nr:glycosyltransferase [Rickettsiales bacterium]